MATSTRLDPETVRELAKRLQERLRTVEIFGAGGCPTCRDAEARAFLVQLHKLADE